jgi:hypothetical protein
MSYFIHVHPPPFVHYVTALDGIGASAKAYFINITKDSLFDTVVLDNLA